MRAAAYRASLRALDTIPSLQDTPAETPWMASIQYDAPKHRRFGWHNACGVLIAPRMLLTCAHPFSQTALLAGAPPINERTYHPRLGGAGLNEGPAFAIIETHIHPGFDPGTAAHDLAVSVLAPRTTAPPIHCDLAPAQTGDQVVALGWSRGCDGHGHLIRAHTTLIDSRVGGGGPGTLCAANLPRPDDLCVGFGGPVIRLNPAGELRLRGIISHGAHGIDINEAGPPAMIIDTLAETEFIRRTIHDHHAP
ncbi:trypsin-like serine protease [Amycolatopsis sp. NBC_00345]|uniref:trypsin-like serine protease n=1 Tax=Amycolatopsis sp. NBC_00345 TaxID=2975955 RepID=UPI002E26E14C